MRAMVLEKPGTIDDSPLKLKKITDPELGKGEILIKVSVCGVCHTDLHIVEGEIIPPSYPVVPGHQVVGLVEATGENVSEFNRGDRVGLAWLRSTCGECGYCLSARENICENILFNGFHANGGYAEYVSAPAAYAYKLPQDFPDVEAAPLLCAGIIGYRSLRLTGVGKSDKLALYGFGASAHITIQVAKYIGCEVYVFSRSEEHLALAMKLGANWVGSLPDKPDVKMNGSIIFAPEGSLVPTALELTAPGGTVALAGIHMSDIPSLSYSKHIYHERALRSVANSTKQDGVELLKIASEIPVRTEVQTFTLEEANEALLDLKSGAMQGAGVLVI